MATKKKQKLTDGCTSLNFALLSFKAARSSLIVFSSLVIRAKYKSDAALKPSANWNKASNIQKTNFKKRLTNVVFEQLYKIVKASFT